jgi:hypothetical protein
MSASDCARRSLCGDFATQSQDGYRWIGDDIVDDILGAAYLRGDEFLLVRRLPITASVTKALARAPNSHC